MRIGRVILDFACATGMREWEAANNVWLAACEDDGILKKYGIDLTGISGIQERFIKIIDQLESKFSVDNK